MKPTLILFCFLLAVCVPASTDVTAVDPHIVRRALPSRLQSMVVALGDRLEKQGKERARLSVAISRGASVSHAIVTWQLPGLFRMDFTDSQTTHSIGFDGTVLWSTAGAISAEELTLVETLLQDSPEHLALGVARGLAFRPITTFLRLDDGQDRAYSGPFYDVYQLVDALPGDRTPKPKFYYINSLTHLLERVQYDLGTGKVKRVAVVLSGWLDQQDQRVAGKIVRSEDGQQVLAITVEQAEFAPAQDDGVTFSQPHGGPRDARKQPEPGEAQ